MTSFLDQIRTEIAKGFKGKLRRGTLRRRIMLLNEFNDLETVSYTEYIFDGIRADFDARYRQQASIPETDVKILVILGSLAIVPTQEDEILIEGQWHRVRQVLSIDPANAHADLQVYQIATPTEPEI